MHYLDKFPHCSHQPATDFPEISPCTSPPHNLSLLGSHLWIPLLFAHLCVSVTSVGWINRSKVGEGISSSQTLLKCMLKHFNESSEGEDGYGVCFLPRKLQTFCEIDLPSFGVWWPSEKSLKLILDPMELGDWRPWIYIESRKAALRPSRG